MANVARCYRRLFPFFAATPDLDGESFDTGRIGFGTPPRWTRAPGPTPPDPMTRATGWRPVIASFGYSALDTETVARVIITFEEQNISEDAYKSGGGFVAGARYRQVIFDEPAVNFVYFAGLPVPVAEENGNPFNLRIRTVGRADPSQVVVDWEWARFSLDVTIDNLSDLAAMHAQRLVGGGNGG